MEKGTLRSKVNKLYLKVQGWQNVSEGPMLTKGSLPDMPDMAPDDDFGPTEYSDDFQTAILCKKNMQTSHFLCATFSPAHAVPYIQLT